MGLDGDHPLHSGSTKVGVSMTPGEQLYRALMGIALLLLGGALLLIGLQLLVGAL